VDVGLIDAIRAGTVTIVPAVTGFDAAHVLLADAAPITVDAVIAATGYTSDLQPLVGHLGVLNDRGLPNYLGPRTHPDTPGLYFTGFTNPISGMLRELNIDARRIATAVASQRETTHTHG
jgi:putative flavoprotein involved in K+ transport